MIKNIHSNHSRISHVSPPQRPGHWHVQVLVSSWAPLVQSLSPQSGMWSWWRHQMEIFSASLALCARNSPITGEFPLQRSVTRSFDVCVELRLNKRSSKQSRRRWLETPSRSLWRHCNYIKEEMPQLYKALWHIHMLQWPVPSLVQVVSWRQQGTTPLP